MVIHTMVARMSSVDAEFTNPSSQLSSHYGVGLDATVHQYVNLDDSAWANGILEEGNVWAPIFGTANPNRRTISIETEDNGDVNTPVTDAQFNAVLGLVLEAQLAYPGIQYIVGHHAISPISRSCPAARWLDSGRLDQLAYSVGLPSLK